MAKSNTNFQRSPSPSPKYPFVGPNYLKHGEVAGYVYYPWNDNYYLDKKSQQAYQEATGQAEKPKTPPGLGTVLAGTAGLAGATALAQQAGKGIASNIFGGGAATAATDATTGLASAGTDAITGGATQAATQGGTGFLGLGGNAATTTAAAPEGVATGINGGTVLADGSTVGAPGMVSGVASNLGSLGGLAGAGVGAGVLGGIALGAKGANDIIRGNETSGGLDWASRATIGIATGGLSELARPFFAKPKTEVEDKRLEDLKAKGLLDPNFIINKESRSREDQLKDLEKTGTVDEKKKKWLETGDEQYLTGQDLQGYAAFLEKDPKDVTNRIKLAEDALRAGAVNEHHGTVDVDWKKLEEWRAKNGTTSQPNQQGQQNINTQPQVNPQNVRVNDNQAQAKGLLGAFR